MTRIAPTRRAVAIGAAALFTAGAARAQGDPVHVRSVGSGTRTWVLLHPWSASGKLWETRAAAVSKVMHDGRPGPTPGGTGPGQCTLQDGARTIRPGKTHAPPRSTMDIAAVTVAASGAPSPRLANSLPATENHMSWPAGPRVSGLAV